MRRCSRGPDLGTRESFPVEMTLEPRSESWQELSETEKLKKPVWGMAWARGPQRWGRRVGLPGTRETQVILLIFKNVNEGYDLLTFTFFTVYQQVDCVFFELWGCMTLLHLWLHPAEGFECWWYSTNADWTWERMSVTWPCNGMLACPSQEMS